MERGEVAQEEEKMRVSRPALLLVLLLLPLQFRTAAGTSPEELAAAVTIYRDSYGVPHIDGPTDASVVFGFAYAQAEDYFWQVEDTYIMALGRYAEVNGEAGLENDLLNRTFEVPARARAAYETLDPDVKAIAAAFAAGLNWYLKNHPEEKPRLITRFEPWHVMAYNYNTMLGFIYGNVHVSKGEIRKNLEGWRAHVGSNAWVIGPAKTRSGKAMLFSNPHQPYFGHGQFIEGHLRSAEGLNVSGASLIGGILITIGHNENLGWSHTVNDPDVADAWIETFDDPEHPLNYRYDGGYRTATEWKDSVGVKTPNGVEERTYTFRKTHHGPIVGKADETRYYSARIAHLFESDRIRQALMMGKARNIQEFKRAMAALSLQMFNTVYADRQGNIYYLYNGAVPRRDPGFNWARPVDGSTPKTEWTGIHSIAELPQVLNPLSGFVQSCNSSPFTTTDDGNPSRNDFPAYMAEDRDDDKRRAKVSRKLLREMKDVTFEDWQAAAFDTTLYWPMTQLPAYALEFESLRRSDPQLAEKVGPLLQHLLDWDYRNSTDSTQATLCVEWYSQLYEGTYPAETLRKQYLENPSQKFEALAAAAERLSRSYGTWKVPWGQIYRIQRHANVADIRQVPFRDSQPSLPSVGVPGPLGVAFTVYYSPPFLDRKYRYAIVGSSFMGVYEFGERIQARTLLQFGQSGRPSSPHFFDQARFFSERKFKPAWFYWDDVTANTKVRYHPGREPRM